MNKKTNKKMKALAVLTSGGDAPGMNAAIRAVTRAAIHQGLDVYGIQNGMAGLIHQQLTPLRSRDVGGILSLGGTILGSSRCPEMKTPEGRQSALNFLRKKNIDGLVIIGGNGSQTASYHLSILGFPVVGVASTIDNDLWGSEITIGVDTALNIALESIDRIKTTASSHHKLMLVEVMGRDCGYLVTMAGLTSGAEVIIIPEVQTTLREITEKVQAAYKKGKSNALIVVAEGASLKTQDLMNHFKGHQEESGFDVRSTILGHVQRGGSPTFFDRMLATRLGMAAVEGLLQGNHGALMGINKGKITATELSKVVGRSKRPDPELLKLNEVLAT